MTDSGVQDKDEAKSLNLTGRSDIQNLTNLTQGLCKNEPERTSLPVHPSLCFIHQLPGEILCDIFFTCVLDDWEEEGPLVAGSSHTNTGAHRIPWSLSQVCSKWRHLALELSRIWAYIIVRPDLAAPRKASIENIHLCVNTMLQRSGDWPLHLSFMAETDDMDHVLMFNHWLSVLQTIMEHAHKWKVVRFTLSAIFVKHLDFVKDRIDQLEECYIRVREAIDDVHERFDMLNGSQSLRKLDVWNLPLMPTSTPWPQLTHYTGAFFPFTQLKLIQMMPMLSHLKISRVNAVSTVPATCARLVDLWIPDHSVVFLDCLVLPALQSLRIDRVRRLNPITSVIQRSGCQLQSLNITVLDPVAIDAIQSMLRELPSLTTLFIQDNAWSPSGINSYLFAVLSPYSPTLPLIPKLLDLRIRFYYKENGIDAARQDAELITFVRSRWSQSFYSAQSPVARLQKVRVEIPWTPGCDIPAFLESLQGEGLETSCSFHSQPNSDSRPGV